MILYTPMQLELVLAGLDQMDHSSDRKVTVNGVPAIVRKNSAGKEEIVQLLSTNPNDYLRGDLLPGTQIIPDCAN
ncbi:YlzJ-like family protein [Desulfotruncus alcoholivorax]|uniref:YlzJ-like family protein n=1 Tax=Desulfotruncus alcoholivorax TaxID=265477 RepID=UPI0004113B4F|nr:YlzJ-like family protein [Desulfotruncus alcoholivorax]